MSEITHLEAFICKHAERVAAHANLFTCVAPEAIGAQDALFHTLVKDLEARRKYWEDHEMFPISILRTKFEQVLRLKPSSCREQDLFFQVRGRANLEKIARFLNYKL